MRDSLANNISRLASLRKLATPRPARAGRLRQLTAFGANPGQLDGWTYIPASLAADAPLIVVLHGCTQSAADYDAGSGWSQLADRHGFALLFAQQRRSNNGNLCFNWFDVGDTRRDAGEPASIKAMIDAVVAAEPIDARRIFVTGLSAGGAMASVMLATYPEIFAGGAIIAGLPFGSATSVSEALQQMGRPGSADGAALAAKVRAASSFAGPWPKVSVWHGTADGVVHQANADASVAQWRAVHGLAEAPSDVAAGDGYTRAVWRDADGRECVEQVSVAGLGHGTPVGTHGSEAVGTPGPHMLASSVSSTYRIAAFFDLVPEHAADAARPDADPAPAADPLPRVAPAAAPGPAAGVGPAATIERALRAAGLM